MASWSRIVGSAILLVLATAVFGGASAGTDDRGVSVTSARDVLAREFSVSGTADCGRRSGLRCEIDPPFLLTIWTEDISGSRERVSIDVSWIVRQLDGIDQDDLICLNVQTVGDGTLQAVGTWTPCGPPEPTKRPRLEKDQKSVSEVAPTATATATATPVPTQTQSPSATVTHTATPTVTATVTPTFTPTPVINLSLTKAGVRGPFVGIGYITTWTITVVNSGPNIAHNVVVIDRPIEGLTTVTLAVVSQGAYNTATNRWTVGTIGVGQQQTAVLTFAPSFGDPTTFNWVNEAEVESADEHDPNSTPNNNNPAEDDQDSETLEVPL